MIYKKGDIYEGEFKDGKRNGKGKIEWYYNLTYYINIEGIWENDILTHKKIVERFIE